jgi:hypothetical protein
MVAIQHADWEAYGKLRARKSRCFVLTGEDATIGAIRGDEAG